VPRINENTHNSEQKTPRYICIQTLDKKPNIYEKRPNICDKKPNIYEKTPSICDKKPNIYEETPTQDTTPCTAKDDKTPMNQKMKPTYTQRRLKRDQ